MDEQYNGGVGLANPNLGIGRRKMLDLANKLHSTGVQVDIDLPQIAVIGSQSAGKSSLIESISGITLPRESGTCTRVPTECRLSRSDSRWQCTVSLRFITDKRGNICDTSKQSAYKFGEVIYDKSEVEDRLRRAQLAILSPSKKHRNFLKGNSTLPANEDGSPGRSELNFSTNFVSLEISGPDVADLSFCDLPGLIASSTNSSQDIELVKNLVTSYIRKPSCIILLTVACEISLYEADFENQGAHSLAKQYDKKGERTIGVLTKPDRIPDGEAENWLPFIRNTKERLAHNWFCVRQLSSEETKTIKTWEDARAHEEKWFATTSPWRSLDTHYKKYLGTTNLVERLSLVLSNLVSDRLPGIQKEVAESIAKVRHSLKQLPPKPPSDPRSAICTALNEFTNELKQHISGGQIAPPLKLKTSRSTAPLGLIQAIRPYQEDFRRKIRHTAPNFRPFESEFASKRHLGKALFLESEEGHCIDGEDSEDDEADAESVVEVHPGTIDLSNVDDEEEDDDADASEVDSDIAGSDDDDDDEEEEEEPEAKPAPKPKPKPKVQKQVKRTTELKRPLPDSKIYIEEVMATAQMARSRELPGHYPFVVQETFIENIMRDWDDPALQLCHSVHRTVKDHVNTLIDLHFSKYGQGHLRQRVRVIFEDHITLCLEECKKKVLWLLDMENKPFSLNTHYLEDYKNKFLTHYRAARQKYQQSNLLTQIQMLQNMRSTPAPAQEIRKIATNKRAESDPRAVTAPPQPTGLEKVLIGLAEMGMHGMKPEDLLRLVPPDAMDPALNIMADVRAYFQVAYKRFADNVPIAVDLELVRAAEKGLLLKLYSALGINGADGERVCEDFVRESSQNADLRSDLLSRLNRLELASQELLSIGLN
ncbi:P-loop containing nucleoside triphosphate hydrolase protein [Panaeolus papilionaceus]|nr:P-loop containing nucleoside triphosphate hydrolase protein [Panaeolus papilionaceus]